MTALDRCRALLAEAIASLRDGVPSDPEAALLALLRAGEGSLPSDEPAQETPPGWNLALRLCLEAQAAGTSTITTGSAWQVWAERFLAACDQAARAELALARCAAGSLQLQEGGTGAFVAWPTSKRLLAEQRERADLKWWSAQSAQQVAPRTTALAAERAGMIALLHQSAIPPENPWGYVVGDPAVAQFYQRLGRAALARLAPQHSYPAEAAIGGATFARYGAILGLLIGWLSLDRDRRVQELDAAPILLDEGELVAALAAALDVHPEAIGQALQISSSTGRMPPTTARRWGRRRRR